MTLLLEWHWEPSKDRLRLASLGPFVASLVLSIHQFTFLSSATRLSLLYPSHLFLQLVKFVKRREEIAWTKSVFWFQVRVPLSRMVEGQGKRKGYFPLIFLSIRHALPLALSLKLIPRSGISTLQFLLYRQKKLQTRRQYTYPCTHSKISTQKEKENLILRFLPSSDVLNGVEKQVTSPRLIFIVPTT